MFGYVASTQDGNSQYKEEIAKLKKSLENEDDPETINEINEEIQGYEDAISSSSNLDDCFADLGTSIDELKNLNDNEKSNSLTGKLEKIGEDQFTSFLIKFNNLQKKKNELMEKFFKHQN